MGDHLFVIATEACGEGKHLLINLSTIRPASFYDGTCVVEPGEHPFVTAQSYAVYRGAIVQAAERLTKMVDGWVYKAHHDASEALTDRIYAGVGVSRFTPKHIKNYLQS